MEAYGRANLNVVLYTCEGINKHSPGNVNDQLWRSSCDAPTSVNMSRGEGIRWGGALGPDLALYPLPVVFIVALFLFFFYSFQALQLALQLLEDSSAGWQRAVDITQKSLRVGVTVSDKAVIQLLQLIGRKRKKEKNILKRHKRRHVSFRRTMEWCCRRRLNCACVL